MAAAVAASSRRPSRRPSPPHPRVAAAATAAPPPGILSHYVNVGIALYMGSTPVYYYLVETLKEEVKNPENKFSKDVCEEKAQLLDAITSAGTR